MHTPRTSRLDRLSRFLRLILVRRGLLALGIALLAAVFLFSPGVTKSLSSPIIAVGLDPLRAALIVALLSTTGTALVSALLSRQRLGAIAGAGIAYALSYLLPFIHQEQFPVFDPGGHIETLNMSALEHTVMVLLASSLLCAFLGAAIGSALGGGTSNTLCMLKTPKNASR